MLEVFKKNTPKVVTLTLIVVATIAAFALYSRHLDQPWTRDGQVRADVVKIVARVEGYIVRVAVKDNQFVRKGDLLFEIDQRDYQLAVDKANVELDQAHEDVKALAAAVRAAQATVQQQEAAVTSAQSKIAEAQAGVTSAKAAVQEANSGVASARAMVAQTTANLEEAQREADRAKRLADQRAGSIETAEARAASVKALQAELDSANAGLDKAQAALAKAQAGEEESAAKLVVAQNGFSEAQAMVLTANANYDQTQATLGEPGEANVRIRSAKVQLEQSQLNLSWTSIHAPADGYVTNMNLLNSTFVSPGTPFALFVDASSFRVDAYFQETKLKHIQPGDRAIITLMGHHDRPIEGEVESIGYAINPPQLAQTEGPDNLIPTIEPTFEWIRLAQRVPVRIRFKEFPADLHLVAGTTASISIRD